MSGDQPGDIRRIGEDPEAFERFYREQLPLVRRFVARRVDDPQLAADLTADVFQHVTLGGSLTGPEAFQVVGWKGC